MVTGDKRAKFKVKLHQGRSPWGRTSEGWGEPEAWTVLRTLSHQRSVEEEAGQIVVKRMAWVTGASPRRHWINPILNDFLNSVHIVNVHLCFMSKMLPVTTQSYWLAHLQGSGWVFPPACPCTVLGSGYAPCQSSSQDFCKDQTTLLISPYTYQIFPHIKAYCLLQFNPMTFPSCLWWPYRFLPFW